VFVATHPRRPCRSENIQARFAPNFFPLNSFADPHPLNPVTSILYKNIGGQGVPATFPLLSRSPIFRTLFQVPYPASPLFATLTKTTGVWGYSSHFGSPLSQWPELANSKIPVLSGRPGRILSNTSASTFNCRSKIPTLSGLSTSSAPLAHGSRDTSHEGRIVGLPRLSRCNSRKVGVLLTNRLLALGGGPHGFIHCGGGLFAEFTLALVAALKILKVILQNFRASLAQAFLGGFVQRGFGPLLGRAIRMLTEAHDSRVSVPVGRILPIALALHLLVQRINQEIVSRQDKRNPYDPQNHEPLEHGTETPSPKLILADFSLAQAARQRRGAHEYLDRASTDAALAGAWAARADNCLTIYWTFCQFPHPQPGSKLKLSQSKVRP